jgi:hypothetical protein
MDAEGAAVFFGIDAGVGGVFYDWTINKNTVVTNLVGEASLTPQDIWTQTTTGGTPNQVANPVYGCANPFTVTGNIEMTTNSAANDFSRRAGGC